MGYDHGNHRKDYAKAPRFPWSCVMMFSAVVCCLVSETCGQAVPPSQLTNALDASGELLTDRRTAQAFELLCEHVREKDVRAAIGQMLLLSQLEPGLLVPINSDGKKTSEPRTWQPLFRGVFDEIHRLPESALKALQKQDEQLAHLELQKMVRGNPASLVSIILRYPVTEAAYQSHLLIAQQHLDRGRRKPAEFWLRPLLAEGIPLKWQSASKRILQRIAPDSERIASTNERAANRPEATDSLRTVRSNEISAESANGKQDSHESAHVTATDVSTVDFSGTQWLAGLHRSSLIQRMTEMYRSHAADDGALLTSNWMPAIDDQNVYVRNLTGVRAIALNAGDVRWSWTAPSLNLAETIESELATRLSRLSSSLRLNSSDFSQTEQTLFAHHLYRDGIFGRLTVDQNHVYLIHNEPVKNTSSGTRPPVAMPGSANRISSISRLIALEKTTGRRIWSVGGEAVEEQFGNELTEARITGPPASDDRFLYALAEQAESISLTCLDAESGQVRWKKPLCFVGPEHQNDQARNLTPFTPLIDDGIIYSDTGTDWLMAVDSLTESILWATHPPVRTSDETTIIRNRGRIWQPPRPLKSVWSAQPLLLENDLLFQTDPESHRIRAIDCQTGEVVREFDGSEYRGVIYADASRIVFWGSSGLQAVDSVTGNKIWKCVVGNPGTQEQASGNANDEGNPLGAILKLFYKNASPSQDASPAEIPGEKTLLNVAAGRGTVRDNVLYVSLTDGTVAAVSMTDGSLMKRISASIEHPGDLISSGSSMLVFNPGWIAQLGSRSTEPNVIPVARRAEQLIREHQFTAALSLLDAVEPSVISHAELRQLQVDALTKLAVELLSEPREPNEENSDRLRSVLDRADAVTMSQTSRAKLLQLRVLHALQVNDPDHLIQVVREAMDSVSSAGPIPVEADPLDAFRSVDISMDGGQSSTVTAAAGRTPDPLKHFQDLNYWLLRQVTAQFASPDTHQSPTLLRFIESLSDEMLVLIDHPAVCEEAMKRSDARADAGLFDDRLAQLLSLAAQSDDLRSRVIRRLLEWRDNADDQDIRYLLTGFIEEQAVKLPVSSIADPGSQLHEIRVEREEWDRLSRAQLSTWPDDQLIGIPVLSNVYRSPDTPVRVLDVNDIYLSRYIWNYNSVADRVCGHAAPAIPPGTDAVPCLLPLTLDTSRPYGESSGTLLRYGTVVLGHSLRTVSAVSAISRRPLWSRSTSDLRYGREPAAMPFVDITIYQRSVLGITSAGSITICGGSDRFICLQDEGRIEIIDLSTGTTRWALRGAMKEYYATATSEAVVLLNTRTRVVECRRLSDGTLIEGSPLTSDDAISSLTAAGRDLIVLRPERVKKNPRVMEWINPANGFVSRRIELPDVTSFQVLDADTLLAYSPLKFSLIDLSNGQVSTFDLPEELRNAESGGTDNAIRSSLTPRPGLFARADLLNVYLTIIGPKRRVDPMQRVGMRSTPLGDALFAFDRTTGELRWRLDTEDMTTATFEEASSPVLMIIQLEESNARNAAGFLGRPTGWLLQCTGILKIPERRFADNP
ncbi:MAG: PQQ-binding-like beta-propeller repeat protein [Planctomycetaceae bacterium]